MPTEIPVINSTKNPFQYLFYHIKNPWNLDKLSQVGDQKLFDALNRLANNITSISKTVEVINTSTGTWVEEVPSGSVDGSNTIFHLSYAPIPGSLDLFLNIEQREGTNFTISSATINFTVAPKVRDVNPTEGGYFFARYQH